MNKVLVNCIAVIAVMGLLYLSNPEKKDFENYIDKKLNEKVENAEGLEKLGSSIFGGVEALSIKATAERRNYYLFSVYQAKVMGKDFKLLGMGRMVVTIKDE